MTDIADDLEDVARRSSVMIREMRAEINNLVRANTQKDSQLQAARTALETANSLTDAGNKEDAEHNLLLVRSATFEGLVALGYDMRKAPGHG